MIKIELKTVFTIIILIILLVGAVYGTYILYWGLDPNTKLNCVCAILSIMLQIIIGMFILMMINELSKKTIEINTDKIKEKLKQLIK